MYQISSGFNERTRSVGKLLCHRLLMGATGGLAANQIISWVSSYALRLGYFTACPAALPERVGGEMNAVLLQMLLFMLLGMGINTGIFTLRRLRGRGLFRLLCGASAACASIFSAIVLVVCVFS